MLPTFAFVLWLGLAVMLPAQISHVRPVIAIVASNDGTELTDFMIPRAILTEANIGDVISVARDTGRVRLRPGGLTIDVDMTIAAFDAAHPKGANYVIVPAITDRENPAIVAWIAQQAARGATIVSICEGAWTVAKAGLLDGHRATSHWHALDDLEKKYPRTTWVRDSRYVMDDRMISTTGVSASLPLSIALIERIAGRGLADSVAKRVGLTSWNPAHDSRAFGFSKGMYAQIVFNGLAWWRHDDVGVHIETGVDEVALALTVEVLSRSYRAIPFTWTEHAAMVTGRQGLHVYVDRPAPVVSAGGKQIRLPFTSAAPAASLDSALARLELWYGRGPATVAAMTLEYPRKS